MGLNSFCPYLSLLLSSLASTAFWIKRCLQTLLVDFLIHFSFSYNLTKSDLINSGTVSWQHTLHPGFPCRWRDPMSYQWSCRGVGWSSTFPTDLDLHCPILYVLCLRSWPVGEFTIHQFLVLVNGELRKMRKRQKYRDRETEAERETRIEPSEMGLLFPWLRSWDEGPSSCPTNNPCIYSSLLTRLHNSQLAMFTLGEDLD